MKRPLHIIASCSDRKAIRAGDPIQLRTIPSGRGRLQRWWRALHVGGGPALAATDLYVGAHWAVVRGLPAVAESQGLDVELWVASAGYGLVPASAMLHSYSATFAAQHPDSIASSSGGREARDAHATWWAALAQQRLPGVRSPRSVAALARANRSATVLVLGSPDYVAALKQDLLAARDELAHPAQLIVISSDKPSHLGGLRQNVAPSDARLLGALGEGTRVSLHAQAARKMLEEVDRYPLRADVQRRRFEELLAGLPAFQQPRGREPRSDADVKAFIRRALVTRNSPARTRLLREFRAAGHKCEQGRFKKLYAEVAGGHAD